MASSQVDVQTQALTELKSALVAFRGSAGEQLRGIQQYLQQAWAVFEQAERAAQEEVKQCYAILQQLRENNRSAARDGMQIDLSSTAQRLRQAEEHYGKVRHHKREVEQAIKSYIRQAQQLDQHLANEVPRATLALIWKIGLLNRYQTTVPGVAVASVQGIASQFDGADQQGIHNDMGRLAEQLAPIGASIKYTADLSRDVQYVRLTDLPQPDIKGADDFKKVSLEEMKAGILLLQEMLPIIQQGTGNNAEYWGSFDQQCGLSRDKGYQRIYEAFYGNDAIKLERVGNQYTIINGQHRIWLAKQMGIDSLPARIVVIDTSG